jgi:putative phosphoesterase
VTFVVGLISDTHGLLRPEALSALQGSRAILHAGDVGDSSILERLKTIAPVHAVRGNVDTEPWCKVLPQAETVNLSGASIYLLHNLEKLDLSPKAAGFQIVISGHTHKPESHWRDGVLYINPGSAGPRRFSLPICLALLDLSETPWRPAFIPLDAHQQPAGHHG